VKEKRLKAAAWTWFMGGTKPSKRGSGSNLPEKRLSNTLNG